MADIHWSLTVHDHPHQVRLRHANLSGLQEIWVDERLVNQDRKVCDHGSRQILCIEEEEFELIIHNNHPPFYTYFLLRNGYPIPSEQDIHKGKTTADLERSAYLRERILLREIGRELDLTYLPFQDCQWYKSHRLAGFYQGYFVVIQKGVLPQSGGALTWLIYVHHAPKENPETGFQMRGDPRFDEILGKFKRRKDFFEDNPSSKAVLFPISKKETLEQTVAKIKGFLALIAEQERPLALETCENPQCRRGGSRPYRIVLFDGAPRLYCQDCIDDIPEQLAQRLRELHAAPRKLLPGLLAGGGIALLGVIAISLLGLLPHFLANIAAMIGVWILPNLIIRTAGKVGTKLTTLNLLCIGGLTIASSFLGLWGMGLTALLAAGTPLSPEMLLLPFARNGDEPGVLLLFSLAAFLQAMFFLPIWLTFRIDMKAFLKPRVEIFPGP